MSKTTLTYAHSFFLEVEGFSHEDEPFTKTLEFHIDTETNEFYFPLFAGCKEPENCFARYLKLFIDPEIRAEEIQYNDVLKALGLCSENLYLVNGDNKDKNTFISLDNLIETDRYYWIPHFYSKALTFMLLALTRTQLTEPLIKKDKKG